MKDREGEGFLRDECKKLIADAFALAECWGGCAPHTAMSYSLVF